MITFQTAPFAIIRDMAMDTSSGWGTTFTTSFPQSVIAGSILIVSVYTTFSDATQATLSDSAGNSWTSASWDSHGAVWYSLNAKAGATSVTITFGNDFMVQVHLYELAVAGAATLVSTGTGALASGVSPTVTARAAAPGQYAMAFMWAFGMTVGGGSVDITVADPFVIQQHSGGPSYTGAVSADCQVTTTGPLTASFTISSPEQCGALMLVFGPASGRG